MNFMMLPNSNCVWTISLFGVVGRCDAGAVREIRGRRRRRKTAAVRDRNSRPNRPTRRRSPSSSSSCSRRSRSLTDATHSGPLSRLTLSARMVRIVLFGHYPRNRRQRPVLNVIKNIRLRHRDVRLPFGTIVNGGQHCKRVPKRSIVVGVRIGRSVVLPRYRLSVEQIAHRRSGIGQARKRPFIEQVFAGRRQQSCVPILRRVVAAPIFRSCSDNRSSYRSSRVPFRRRTNPDAP